MSISRSARVRLVSVAFGAVFGFFLTWGRLSDPDVIRRMLLLQEAYLYLMLGSAVAVGFVGVRILRGRGTKALLTGEPVGWRTARPTRRHVGGAALFGLGWAIANTCPGPVVSQIATGVWWSGFTIAGIFLGLKLHALRHATRAPAAEQAPRTATASASA
jgi:uncharacterized membrane protein YedE/YeeE